MADVFVTGASGFVARNLRSALSSAGTSVISASRTRIPPLSHETVIRTGHYTEDTIPTKITGCRAAIHLIGTGMQTADTAYQDVNHTITQRILDICKKADIPHIIYLSGLGVRYDSPLSYFISKHHAEQNIIKSTLDYTIFRPSYIIGRDDYLTVRLNRQKKKGAIIIPGSGRYLLQPISIQDTIKVIMHAIRTPSRNHILDLVGPQIMSFLQLARTISGPNTPVRHIDIDKAYQHALLDPNPAYRIDDLNIMISGYTGNYDALRRYAGINLQTIQDTLYPGGIP